MENETQTIQHVYHHNDPTQPKITLGIEKNTKGYNWSVSVSGASGVAEALVLLNAANEELKAQYGQQA